MHSYICIHKWILYEYCTSKYKSIYSQIHAHARIYGHIYLPTSMHCSIIPANLVRTLCTGWIVTVASFSTILLFYERLIYVPLWITLSINFICGTIFVLIIKSYLLLLLLHTESTKTTFCNCIFLSSAFTTKWVLENMFLLVWKYQSHYKHTSTVFVHVIIIIKKMKTYY